MCFAGNLDAIKLLVHYDANLVAENNMKTMPIHSAAMKGHTEVIQILFELDKTKKIVENLRKFSANNDIKSTVYLAVLNDNKTCANW